ncbi:MAG: hypothetical protein WAN75_16665 [Xanthobacteraceae bacterium]
MPIVQLVTVSSGQTLNVASALGSNTLIDVLNGGTLNVLSGGAAFSTVDNGVVHVSGGMVSGTTVETGGELDIFSAGTATETLAGVAIVNVFSGATAIRTTLSGFFHGSVLRRDGRLHHCQHQWRGRRFVWRFQFQHHDHR